MVTNTQLIEIVLKKLERSLEKYNNNKLINNNYKYIDDILEIYLNKNGDIGEEEIKALAKSINIKEYKQESEDKEKEIFNELIEIKNEFINLTKDLVIVKEFLNNEEYNDLNNEILNKTYVVSKTSNIIKKLKDIYIEAVSK